MNQMPRYTKQQKSTWIWTIIIVIILGVSGYLFWNYMTSQEEEVATTSGDVTANWKPMRIRLMVIQLISF